MMLDHNEAHRDEHVLDESLNRLAATGPEFGGGLSNHGPMGAEALVRLGRADDVEPWLDRYIRELEEPPRATDRITDETWRTVLALWWPRLTPGLAASATHGIIRTSHAARSLAAAQTGERVAELARGLAYWAATYFEVPGTASTTGHLDLDAAVRNLPVAARPDTEGLITGGIRAQLAGEPRFPAAVAALRPPDDVPADLLRLGTTFARVFVVYGRNRPIALLHAVTSTVAARSVLGLLPADVAGPTYDRLWQVAAALYTSFVAGATPEPMPLTDPPGPAELTERAVATDDVHAIKLTEACLRLHAESPDPVLLHAAARASELLG